MADTLDASYNRWLVDAQAALNAEGVTHLSPFQSRVLLEAGEGKKAYGIVASFQRHGAHPFAAGPIAKALLFLLDRGLITHQRDGIWRRKGA